MSSPLDRNSVTELRWLRGLVAHSTAAARMQGPLSAWRPPPGAGPAAALADLRDLLAELGLTAEAAAHIKSRRADCERNAAQAAAES